MMMTSNTHHISLGQKFSGQEDKRVMLSFLREKEDRQTDSQDMGPDSLEAAMVLNFIGTQLFHK
jgi:hypothetical protein